jgi:WD40 repeat protein
VPQERMTLRGSDRHFLQVAFSPDSKLLAAGQQDGTIKIWEMPAGTEWYTHPARPVSDVDFSAAVLGLSFNPKGDTLAWTSGKSVVLFDVHAKRVKGTLDGHERYLEPLAFSPDGSTLATATPGFVRLWDLATEKPQVIFEQAKTKYHEPGQPPLFMLSVAFHPDGKTLAVGLGWNVLFLDLARGGTERASVKFPDRMAMTLAFSPNGKLLAGAGSRVVLWDAATAKEVAVLPRSHRGGIRSLAFSPDNEMLAIGICTGAHASSYVELWDIDQGREAGIIDCGNRPLQHLAWSPDGKTIATANSGDNTVKVWDVSTILKNASK